MRKFQVIESGSASEWVWQNKYRYARRGVPVDVSIDCTFARVATWLASAEKEETRGAWTTDFYQAMRDFEFLPAGRILAGAGTDRNVTAANCFVMGRIDDSLDGIMQALRESATTLKAGGGIGMDFSTLRPRGALVAGVDSVSSGAVSFMDLWHTMSGTIMSAGARRGAMMGALRCDHPDIEEFIRAKRQPGRLTNFNLSVLITDPFMKAVEDGAAWPLVFGGKTYRTVQARGLWDEITRLTYDHAEPGVLFIDRMNAENPLAYAETIYATNPCGEQPLPPYGACLLGSINLARLVHQPFSENAELDWLRLDDLAHIAVRALDNVNDLSRYPLQQQLAEAQSKRRIGLGMTGLADALIMLGVRYGSREAVEVTEEVSRLIKEAAIAESIDIGNEKGNFPLFNADAYGSEHRRNSHLTSIAPTGTISLLAGNISSGIEPVFAWSAERKLLQPDGSTRTVEVESYVSRLAKHMEEPRSGPAWVTAEDLTVDDHLAMMAAAQRHVDSAISKTINCPADMTFEEFQGVYRKAYTLGLKGCATYRPTPSRGAVLTRKDQPASPAVPADNVVRIADPLERPEMLVGATYKIKPATSPHALYVTVNDLEDENGRRRPFELFLSSKEADGYAWRVALSRTISAVLRKGGDVAFLADELKQVFDPRGGWFADGHYVPSYPSAIGSVFERHMRSHGLIDGPEKPATAVARLHCPKCQIGGLVAREGCAVCDRCDYSKC